MSMPSTSSEVHIKGLSHHRQANALAFQRCVKPPICTSTGLTPKHFVNRNEVSAAFILRCTSLLGQEDLTASCRQARVRVLLRKAESHRVGVMNSWRF